MTITLIHDCDIERLDDPTANNNGIQDTHLEQEFPNSNANELQAHYAGKDVAGMYYRLHAIFLYDLKLFIPRSATITAAVWWFYVQYTNTMSLYDFWVHRITEVWKENEATWNDRLTGVPWTIPGGTYGDPYANLGAITTVGWKSFNILNIVSDAWNNRGGNCHLLLRRPDFYNTVGYISISGKNQYTTTRQYVHHLRITYTLDGRTFQVMLH